MPQIDRQPMGLNKIADKALVAQQSVDIAEYHRTVTKTSPKTPLIWVKYGHALRETGELAQAESAYQNALSIDWASADSHLQLGRVLRMQGKEAYAEAS